MHLFCIRTLTPSKRHRYRMQSDGLHMDNIYIYLPAAYINHYRINLMFEILRVDSLKHHLALSIPVNGCEWIPFIYTICDTHTWWDESTIIFGLIIVLLRTPALRPHSHMSYTYSYDHACLRIHPVQWVASKWSIHTYQTGNWETVGFAYIYVIYAITYFHDSVEATAHCWRCPAYCYGLMVVWMMSACSATYIGTRRTLPCTWECVLPETHRVWPGGR